MPNLTDWRPISPPNIYGLHDLHLLEIDNPSQKCDFHQNCEAGVNFTLSAPGRATRGITRNESIRAIETTREFAQLAQKHITKPKSK